MDLLHKNYITDGGGDYASNVDAKLFALSLEIGRRLSCRGRWGLIPQAQLQWTHLYGHSFTDGTGLNTIRIEAHDQVLGRLGLAIDHRVSDDQERSLRKIYGIANVLHRFSGDPKTVYNGSELVPEAEHTWGELGVGCSFAWFNEPGDRMRMVYGEAGYRSAFGSSDSHGTMVTLGYRSAW